MSNLSPAAILHNVAGTEVGTATDPLRVDPTGTTAQPVSDGGGSLTVDAASLPLPTGAATAALQTQPGVDIGDVTVNNTAGAGAVNIQDGGNSLTVDGPLTDAELRAAAVPVSAASLPLPAGAATAALQTQPGVDIGDVTVNNTGGASAVNIQDGGNSITVDGPLTDAQLRASAVPVSAASLPLPAGAATAANQAILLSQTDGIEGSLVSIDSKDFATQTTLATRLAKADFDARINTLGQKAMVASTPVTLASDQSTLPVSVATLPLPTGAATEATLATRVAAAQLPAALVGGRLDENVGAWLGSTAPTVGQKNMVASVPVTFAADQTALPVTFTTPGARTGVSFGKVSLGGATAGSIAVLRATPYTEPASAAQRSVGSSSASDSAAGTGARSVRITYFDNTGLGPLSETVVLNGTTPVNTVATNIRFIESLEVITVGSVGTNVGTISLFGATAGGGGTVGTIGVGNLASGIGDNNTLWCHHYVSATHTAQFSVLITGIVSGGSGTSGKFFIRGIRPLVVDSAEVLLGDVVLAIGPFQRSFTFNPALSGFARVTGYVVPGTSNSNCHCAFDWSETLT